MQITSPGYRFLRCKGGASRKSEGNWKIKITLFFNKRSDRSVLTLYTAVVPCTLMYALCMLCVRLWTLNWQIKHVQSIQWITISRKVVKCYSFGYRLLSQLPEIRWLKTWLGIYSKPYRLGGSVGPRKRPDGGFGRLNLSLEILFVGQRIFFKSLNLGFDCKWLRLQKMRSSRSYLMVTVWKCWQPLKQPSPGANVYKKLVPKMVLYQLRRNSLNIYAYL